MEGREGGEWMEGCWEREGGREAGREGGLREGGREVRREGGKEGGREGRGDWYTYSNIIQ